MQLLFLDESGKLDQGGLFALGGIAVRDRDWLQLKDALMVSSQVDDGGDAVPDERPPALIR